MSTEKINIEAILNKHGVEFGNMYNNPSKEESLAAIKEIVEQVIEKCTEEAEAKDLMAPNCDDHTPYWGACISCGKYDNPDIVIGSEVDKESILNVKQLIEYE